MITAIVLAAGEAKRFGDRKQLVDIDGKPLLQHAIDHVNASSAGEVVLVLGAYADEIRKQIVPGRARVVINADHANGMSTSIIAGLNALDNTTDAVMVLLGDQPFVKTATIDHLLAQYEETRALIVIPTHRGVRGNPVIVDRSLFPEMLRLRGDIGFRAMFAAHAQSIAMIAVEDEGVLRDIDTAEDLPRRD